MCGISSGTKLFQIYTHRKSQCFAEAGYFYNKKDAEEPYCNTQTENCFSFYDQTTDQQIITFTLPLESLSLSLLFKHLIQWLFKDWDVYAKKSYDAFLHAANKLAKAWERNDCIPKNSVHATKKNLFLPEGTTVEVLKSAARPADQSKPSFSAVPCCNKQRNK